MGNDSGKGNKGPTVAPPVRPIEVKTYVMACQSKMTLFRNKKIYEIKKKKDEAIAALKQNNLDIAKAKMESVIRLEDTITVYDILGPLCEILKERITYLCTANEVPPDIKAQLDTLIYASTRIDIEELYKLRELVLRQYGSYYIQAAEQNKDGLVNVNVIEKLKIKPPVDAFLTIRLKQLCKEKKINYEFPEEIAPNFDQGMGAMGNNFGGGPPNPYDVNQGMGNNPYAPGSGNDFNNNNNPYSMGNNNNPYAMGNNNNPYGNNNMGPGPGNDFDSYMKNNGPGGMGPGQPGQGGNPYETGNNNNNPFGNSGGNPYDTGNNQGNNPGNNPYASNNDGGNPFNNNNNNSGGNPFEGDTGGNPYA